MAGARDVSHPERVQDYSSQNKFSLLTFKFLTIMDKKDFMYDVTSALESAPEASLEGEVRGI